MSKIDTRALPRDSQITLLVFFGNGRNTVHFGDLDKVSDRTMTALNHLVEIKLIKKTKSGRKGAHYAPDPKKCGIPMLDLDRILEEEDYPIMKG